MTPTGPVGGVSGAVGAVGVGQRLPPGGQHLEIGEREMRRVFEQHRQDLAELIATTRVRLHPRELIGLAHPERTIKQRVGPHPPTDGAVAVGAVELSPVHLADGDRELGLHGPQPGLDLTETSHERFIRRPPHHLDQITEHATDRTEGLSQSFPSGA